MRDRKSCAVLMFIGGLLIVVFAVGLAVERNPAALIQKYRYNLALEQFGVFCSRIWLPAGIIGFPLFLISLIVSMIQEGKRKE